MAIELPAKILGSFDPLMNVGATATFTGMLRNNSGQNPYLDANGNTLACSTTRCRAPRGRAKAASVTRARTIFGRSIRAAKKTLSFRSK